MPLNIIASIDRFLACFSKPTSIRDSITFDNTIGDTLIKSRFDNDKIENKTVSPTLFCYEANFKPSHICASGIEVDFFVLLPITSIHSD